MTLVVFVILLPAVVVITATWAWRYQMRVLTLLHTADRRRRDFPEVRLAGVDVTDDDRVDLDVEHAGEPCLERFSVALDVPSVALSTLQDWRDAGARLVLVVPAGRNIVRFRCVDPPKTTLTLRRVA